MGKGYRDEKRRHHQNTTAVIGTRKSSRKDAVKLGRRFCRLFSHLKGHRTLLKKGLEVAGGGCWGGRRLAAQDS